MSRFHFLKLVPYSVFNAWPVALTLLGMMAGVFAILIFGWGESLNAELEGAYPFYGFLPAFYLLFLPACFASGFSVSPETETEALNPLPLKKTNRLMLRIFESIAITLVWALLPALVFFTLFQENRQILSHLVALWLIARICQTTLFGIATSLNPWIGPRLRSQLERIPLFFVMGLVGPGFLNLIKPQLAGVANQWIANLPPPEILLGVLIPGWAISMTFAWRMAALPQPADWLRPRGESKNRTPTRQLALENLLSSSPGERNLWMTMAPTAQTLGVFGVTSAVGVFVGLTADSLAKSGRGFRDFSFALGMFNSILFLLPLVGCWVFARQLHQRTRLCQILPVGFQSPVGVLVLFLVAVAVGTGVLMASMVGREGNNQTTWFFPLMMISVFSTGAPLYLRFTAPISTRNASNEEFDSRGIWVAVGAHVLFFLMLAVALKQTVFSPDNSIFLFALSFAFNLWAMTWMYRRY